MSNLDDLHDAFQDHWWDGQVGLNVLLSDLNKYRPSKSGYRSHIFFGWNIGGCAWLAEALAKVLKKYGYDADVVDLVSGDYYFHTVCRIRYRGKRGPVTLYWDDKGLHTLAQLKRYIRNLPSSPKSFHITKYVKRDRRVTKARIAKLAEVLDREVFRRAVGSA
jgi:hypothetical protein